MDYSIRKKWLIAFWASWALPILYIFAFPHIFYIVWVLGAMGITYYCAYKQYGTWLLSIQLFLLIFCLSFLILAFITSQTQMWHTLKAVVGNGPLGIVGLATNVYYYVCSYKLRAFNRLYRQKLFAELP